MSRSLFALGLVVGIGIGLYLGWMVSPVQYTNTDLPSLAQSYKDDSVLMIATRYAADGNGEAAQSALAALGHADAAPAIQSVTARAIAAHQPDSDIRRLVALAVAFNAVSSVMTPYLP